MALGFSACKWKVQLRRAVMQDYGGISWISETTLVNVLVVSWHHIPSMCSANCLLWGLRCSLLQVTSHKGPETPCSSLCFGTVLQIIHGDLLEAFTAVRETISCPGTGGTDEITRRFLCLWLPVITSAMKMAATYYQKVLADFAVRT